MGAPPHNQCDLVGSPTHSREGCTGIKQQDPDRIYTTTHSVQHAGLLQKHLQWSLSIKDNLNKGHLYNEGTVYSPNHIKLCKNLPLN